MGRWTTVGRRVGSVGTAYLVISFASIMDYVQALFQFLHRPLFGTVVLGMLWKRATGPGGVLGDYLLVQIIDQHVGVGEGDPSAALRGDVTAREGARSGYVSGRCGRFCFA